MAYSMTGFGRGEKVFDTRKYSIELKSVNSRFCDISIRMPRIFNYLDGDIRRVITDRLLRGKIDVFINYEDQGEAGQTVTVNAGLAKEYAKAAKEIAELTGREDDFGVARLATMQDVLSVTQTEIDEEAIAKELLETLNLAVDGMLTMRKREGDNLVASILGKVDTLEVIRGEIVTRSPEVVEAYKQKLSARINEILTSDQRDFYDDNRLAAEVAIFADKCAIDEEMARLSSHFSQARKILAEEGTVGKKMDFLVQEINREVNTTGSKANDIEITSRVLSMKNLIEEIREQIQNLV
ncbi:MAG: YicC family protein [Clostridiales bacterium]|nr:YicC family protein [Clostridiales bacterium]